MGVQLQSLGVPFAIVIRERNCIYISLGEFDILVRCSMVDIHVQNL